MTVPSSVAVKMDDAATSRRLRCARAEERERARTRFQFGGKSEADGVDRKFARVLIPSHFSRPAILRLQMTVGITCHDSPNILRNLKGRPPISNLFPTSFLIQTRIPLLLFATKSSSS